MVHEPRPSLLRDAAELARADRVHEHRVERAVVYAGVEKVVEAAQRLQDESCPAKYLSSAYVLECVTSSLAPMSMSMK